MDRGVPRLIRVLRVVVKVHREHVRSYRDLWRHGWPQESANLYETIGIRDARNKRVPITGHRASRCSF